MVWLGDLCFWVGQYVFLLFWILDLFSVSGFLWFDLLGCWVWWIDCDAGFGNCWWVGFVCFEFGCFVVLVGCLCVLVCVCLFGVVFGIGLVWWLGD